MTWIVIVTDHRNATLTGASAVSYESPPHREADALKLVELLSAGAASGEGRGGTRSPAASERSSSGGPAHEHLNGPRAAPLTVTFPRCGAPAGQRCPDLRSLRRSREMPKFAPHRRRGAVAKTRRMKTL